MPCPVPACPCFGGLSWHQFLSFGPACAYPQRGRKQSSPQAPKLAVAPSAWETRLIPPVKTRAAQTAAFTCLCAFSARARRPGPLSFRPGDPDLYLRRRCFGGVPLSFSLQPPSRERRSLLSSRWSWRSASAALRASDPAGCAPPRTRLRLGGPPPASYPWRKTHGRLPHLEGPGRRARGSLAALPGIPSSSGRIPQGFLLQPVPRLSMGLQ